MSIIKASPLEVGYDESRLIALNKHFERLINNKTIQCASYCLSRNGKVFANGAVGRRVYNDYENLMLPNTPLRIASITKLMVTVALMKLVEDGLVRLDSQVRDFIPQFNQGDFWQITIFQLLTHTSGMLPDCGFSDCEGRNYFEYIDDYINKYNPENDGEFDWISAALKAGVSIAPDIEWMYCPFGFTILGEIITKISGKHVHQYISDEIFKPLGMNDTTFELTPEMAKRNIIKNDKHKKSLNDIINHTPKTEKEKLWVQIPATNNGITSTPADLVKFGNMCLNMGQLDDVRILGRKTFERITTCAIHDKPNYAWGANDTDRSYGIGFDMKKDCEYIYSQGSFFHEGAGACALIIDPKEEMVAAYFVPFDNVPNGWSPEAVYSTQNVIWSGII